MLNRFQLKLLMLFFMLLDHIGSFIPNTPIWLNYIGRVVAPVFFYLLIDGYFYTRNKNNYAKRLFIAAGIMVIGNTFFSILFPQGSELINFNTYIVFLVFIILLLIDTYFLWKSPEQNKDRMILSASIFAIIPIVLSVIFPDLKILKNNIFLSMAFCIMWLISMEENAIKNSSLGKFRTIVIFFLSLFTEASILGLAMTYIFYKYRENNKALIIYYCILSLFFGMGNLSYQGLFYENIQWMMIFSIPFFYIYNGKKGNDLKYLFYSFYPVHIWILYITSFFIEK
ncbi:MAG: TraX family protein [Clostridiaceae bacterium]